MPHSELHLHARYESYILCLAYSYTKTDTLSHQKKLKRPTRAPLKYVWLGLGGPNLSSIDGEVCPCFYPEQGVDLSWDT